MKSVSEGNKSGQDRHTEKGQREEEIEKDKGSEGKSMRV